MQQQTASPRRPPGRMVATDVGIEQGFPTDDKMIRYAYSVRTDNRRKMHLYLEKSTREHCHELDLNPFVKLCSSSERGGRPMYANEGGNNFPHRLMF